MPILPPENWAEIRKAYLETAEPIRRIAARYGISHSTISNRALREDWPDRPPMGEHIWAPPAAEPSPVPGRHALAKRVDQREPDTSEARITRMLGIIDLQLDQMESRMTSGQPMTTQDEERQARAFAAIAGNLEKVTEAAADTFREAGHEGAGNGRFDAEHMRREIAQRLERLNAQWLARRVLDELSAADVERLYYDWPVWARVDQLPPPKTEGGEVWRVWLVLGGRGSGKTRAGAEWVRAKALGHGSVSGVPAPRIALVGETLGDVRRVMIEGASGLLAIHPAEERPRFEASKMQLTWPNGAIAQAFSAEDPDSLRGPQFAAAWCDEIAKWRLAEEAWDMLQFGLRLGAAPQVAVTTTPRPIPLLKTLIADAATVVTRAGTAANAPNLAPGFLEEMERRYGASALGRQELMGEIVEDTGASLWRRAWIEVQRVKECPELSSIVVAVDPPVTATANSDACGIIVAGLGADGRAYIAADRSLQGREPNVWARAAVAAYREFMADRVVAEVNQGGDLVVGVLRQIDQSVAVRKVRATRGKWLRAEPVAALYAEGRVSHVGRLDVLEDQMCAFGADGLAQGKSPDRVDALVWALTDLMIERQGAPRVRMV